VAVSGENPRKTVPLRVLKTGTHKTVCWNDHHLGLFLRRRIEMFHI